jgi:hypothetical protein
MKQTLKERLETHIKKLETFSIGCSNYIYNNLNIGDYATAAKYQAMKEVNDNEIQSLKQLLK